jgi:hypothetical protein
VTINHLKWVLPPVGKAAFSDKPCVGNYCGAHCGFASKEVMSSAGSRLIDESDKPLVIFDLSTI